MPPVSASRITSAQEKSFRYSVQSIGPQQPVWYQLNSDGYVSPDLNGLQVLINGIAAPILYASENQINAVVPFTVMSTPANLDTATFEVLNPALRACNEITYADC
jgi:uncharacterized protein (TIGR03437 family)